ncbi:MAG: C39 family peptidase [Gammaproteobacteria bacterium]|nr:C39 family peptidase [Gammaproteobacteria bacterium]
MKNKLIKIIFNVSLAGFIFFNNVSFAAQDKSDITASLYRSQVAHFYGIKHTKNLTLLKIKGYQQTEDYTCAPAAVMSLMHYYGKLTDNEMNKITELKIAHEMHTSKETGTTAKQIVNWLKTHGFDVVSGEHGTIDMLKNNLQKGIPTLVEWIDWGGHWELVTGYDAEGKTYDDDKDTLFFTDPSAHFDNVKYMNGITMINPDRFADMWFDMQHFNSGRIERGVYIVAVPKKN